MLSTLIAEFNMSSNETLIERAIETEVEQASYTSHESDSTLLDVELDEEKEGLKLLSMILFVMLIMTIALFCAYMIGNSMLNKRLMKYRVERHFQHSMASAPPFNVNYSSCQGRHCNLSVLNNLANCNEV